ncbi:MULTISPECIES: hypothetical protein [unclassified Polaribacter]|uniref:hypothetical protein n=1 Tax=unclassified Polaribacter TaxID=196858 RepID=UPI000068CAC9|nr:hypothetical protein [Polaribacter sp. MED152]EAQ41270.1 hypothetical protein MED152_01110 [Polaribacter sp. MED152]
MKKGLKIISDISIILFGISLIVSKFNESLEWNSSGLRNVLVIIYLITGLYYYRMEIKDKNREIEELKLKLKKTKNEI